MTEIIDYRKTGKVICPKCGKRARNYGRGWEKGGTYVHVSVVKRRHALHLDWCFDTRVGAEAEPRSTEEKIRVPKAARVV